MAKAKFLTVLLGSLGSGHKRVVRRLRTDGKLEKLIWDPLVRQEVLYREIRKVRTLKD
ncbi:hypothetical protein RvY_12822 [Ramazzottius varieornatus]|uniref:39S ribosomal protein L33, mitochondrial n=1 Tax=Ramazzottius varieornatus TaxID=947166 RepID=A0A1D1VUG9_RAMVA|nr:hypothetical protein RvY_12822 [Ramazzottius varieornatus]